MDFWKEFALQFGFTVGIGAIVFVAALVAISHYEAWRQRRYMQRRKRR